LYAFLQNIPARKTVLQHLFDKFVFLLTLAI